jgi:hypothetical protein
MCCWIIDLNSQREGSSERIREKKKVSPLDALLKMPLTKLCKVLPNEALDMLKNCIMDRFTEDLRRCVPLLDNFVDEGFLDYKRVISR